MVPEQATRDLNPDRKPCHQPRVRRQGDTYRLGEMFIFPFIFTEPVVVRGVPDDAVGTRLRDRARTLPLRFGNQHDCSLPTRYRPAITMESRGGLFPGPALFFASGDSYMALDGASVRALADGSPALLVSRRWLGLPYAAVHTRWRDDLRSRSRRRSRLRPRAGPRTGQARRSRSAWP